MDGDVLSAVFEADDARALLDKIQMATRTLGFDYCAYGLKAPLPVTNPRVTLLSTYSRAWCEHYRRSDYLQSDPTVRHCQQSTTPVVWGSDLSRCATAVGRRPADRPALRLGAILPGWTQCRRHAHLGPLSRSDRGARAAQQRDEDALACQCRSSRLFPLVVPSWQPNPSSPLTCREIEVLRWAADGKTLNEVADILCLSVETVKFHTRNAAVKLGLPTAPRLSPGRLCWVCWADSWATCQIVEFSAACA